MKRYISLFLFFLTTFFLLKFPSPVLATTYYVAGDSGLDTNDGSESSPWQTIQKAALTMVAGDTVNVKGGVTYTDSNVVAANPGTSDSYITYKAWPGTGIPFWNAFQDNFDNAGNYVVIDGFRFRSGIKCIDFISNGIIRNSIFEYCPTAGVLTQNTVNVHNNIFYRSMGLSAIIVLNGITTIQNNIFNFNDATTYAIWVVGGSINTSNNIFHNVTNYCSGCSLSSTDIIADPQFISPQNSNFHLKPGSPAINAGIPVSGVDTDIVGVSRTIGGAPDIGAYEYYDMPVEITTNNHTGNQGTKDTPSTFSFHKVQSPVVPLSFYSVDLDPGRKRSFNLGDIPISGNGSSSFTWKDTQDYHVAFNNEDSQSTTDDEIRVTFKGLTSQGLSEGKHSWSVTPHDRYGAFQTKTVDLVIDTTPPTLSDMALNGTDMIFPTTTYKLPQTKRMPSFSGLVTDIYNGSEKTYDNGEKESFENVSSGPKTVTLSIEKLKESYAPSSTASSAYKPYLSSDTQLPDSTDIPQNKKTSRFFLLTPFPLVDGYYKVTLTPKDNAGNSSPHLPFYISLNYNYLPGLDRQILGVSIEEKTKVTVDTKTDGLQEDKTYNL